MKARSITFVTLLLVPFAAAAEPQPAIPPILALAPADALAILYLAKPTDIFAHSFWDTAELSDTPEIARFLDATNATFRGPTMIAVCGSPMNPATLRLEFAIQPEQGAEEFFRQLEESWFAYIGWATMLPSGSMDRSGDIWTLHLPGPLPLPVFAAHKNGLVYGSSRYDTVSAWLEGGVLPLRFANGEDAAKLSTENIALGDIFAYVNLRPLMPMASAELDRILLNLSAMIGLDQLNFATLTARWLKNNPDLTISAGLEEGDGIAWKLLAPPSRSIEIASLIPADYTWFDWTALTSAADVVEYFSSISGTIDPDIRAEFEQECAEFREEYGIHPVDDFTRNFVDEWIIAGKFHQDVSHSMVAAVRLADAAAFELQMARLIRGFDLQVESTTQGDAVVHFALPTAGVNIAWAVIDDYLVLSNRPEPIFDVALKTPEDESLLDSAALADVRRHLPANAGRLTFLNVADFARLAAEEIRNLPEPEAEQEALQLFETLSTTDAGLGMAVTRKDGLLTIELTANDALSSNSLSLVWRAIGESLARSRQQAKRMMTLANMRGIALGCLIHVDKHKGAWPAGLGDLIEADLITPAMCRSPFDPSREEITATNVDATSSYLYRPGAGLAPDDVILCERHLHYGGACFAFADGHAAWHEGPDAERLLAIMRASTH